MRIVQILLFIALMFPLSPIYAVPEASEVFLNNNPQLAKAMGIPEVKAVYDACFEHGSAGTGIVDPGALMGCVWNGSEDKSIPGISQSEELKKKVTELISSKIDDKNKSAKEESSKVITSRSIDKFQKDDKNKKSKSLQALEEYLKKKLELALNGKTDLNKGGLVKTERVTDQLTFHRLFESQVGKNVIGSLSSYCMETFTDGAFFLIYENLDKRNKTRQINLSSLEKLSADGGNLAAASHWNGCIASLQDHCYMTENKVIENKNGELQNVKSKYSSLNLETLCSEFDNKENKNDKETCKPIVKYTQQRACEVVDYVNNARLSLEANQKIVEGYKKLNKGNTREIAEIDELTTLTSNELASTNTDKNGVETNVFDAADSELAEFNERCFSEGKIIDQEKCTNYIQTNKDDRLQQLAEMKLNSEVSLSELERLKAEGNEEEFVRILNEDGYNEHNEFNQDELRKLASQEEVKNQIISRYKSKQEALERTILEEMKKITSSKASEVTIENDKTKLEEIENSIKSKTENFAKLVHYNNIVSGYLNISGKDEKGNNVQKKNSALLAREMNNNLFNKENFKNATDGKERNLAGTGLNYETINDKFKSTGIEDLKDGDKESVTLRPRQIVEQILGLFTKAKKE